MSEHRFYIKHNYECPECGLTLEWQKRPDLKDSLVLFHCKAACSRSEKYFYPPVQALEEFSGSISRQR